MTRNRTSALYGRCSAVVTTQPFPHFTMAGFYEPQFANSLSDWLLMRASWARARHHFYDQYELSFLGKHCDDPDAIVDQITAVGEIRRVSAIATEMFGLAFRPHVAVTAHKLVPGQGIGIHIDTEDGQESHRIIVQLSKGWSDAQGGQLVLLTDARTEAAHKLFKHVFNTAVGFQLGQDSYHAVTDVLRGERLTVIYGLWSVDAPFDADVQSGRSIFIGA